MRINFYSDHNSCSQYVQLLQNLGYLLTNSELKYSFERFMFLRPDYCKGALKNWYSFF